MIFRFSLAISVLALLGNVVAPPPHPPPTLSQHPHDDAIELQNLQPHHKHKSSLAPPLAPPLAHPLAPPLAPPPAPPTPPSHDHVTLHQTITALNHAEKENLKTSRILHHGENKFIEHRDYAPGLHLRTAARYGKAANEHHNAAHRLSSKAQSLKSASGQVSVTKLQELHHYAKASTAKARSNKNIAKNGIGYLEGAKLPNYLYHLEKRRGEHGFAQKFKEESQKHYKAAVLSIPELDATQSVHSP